MSGSGVKISDLPALPSVPTGTEPVPLVRGGVTYQAPSDYLDNLAPSIPYASTLTGDEITGIEQGSERALSTLNDQLRLSASRHTGLTFDNVAQAIAQVASLSIPLGSIITTANYATVNDFGGGTYVRVAEQPTTHSGWFQDSVGVYWELWSDVYRPEQFGVWSGGVTGSDTAIILSAMKMAAISGRSARVSFVAGRRYRCGALLIPNIPSSGNGSYLTLASDGWSFIEAIDEGDAGYLWAPSNWLSGSSGNRRTVIKGLYFDANSIKDYALVVRGNSWEISRCYFTGALQKGWFHTNNSRANDAEGGSVNCFFFNCESRQNPGDGWEFDSYSVDYQVIRCLATGNGRWGAKFMNGAGCQIDAINVYGNNSSGDGGCAFFDQWGWATICANSLFDGSSQGDVVVRSNNPTYAATWGPRNNVKNGNLICEVLSPKLVLLDIEMQGGSARIIHNNGASPGRQLQIMGGKSSAVPFILFSDNNSGTTIASNHYNQGTDAWYDGRILTYPARVTEGHAPSVLLPGRYSLSASGTTTITIPLTVPPEGLAGSWIEAALKVSVLSDDPDVAVSLGWATVRAMVGRQFKTPVRKSGVEVLNLMSAPIDAITVAASVNMPGSSGVMTATITIIVTHPIPISDDSGVLYVDVTGLHRSVTAMTIAVV